MIKMNKFIKTLFLSLSLIFVFSGCNNIIQVNEPEINVPEGKALVKFNVAFDDEENDSRTVFAKYKASELTDIKISYKRSNQSNWKNEKFDTFAQMQQSGFTLELDENTYDFKFSAKVCDTEFTSEVTGKSVVANTVTTVNFTLSISDETKNGKIYIYGSKSIISEGMEVSVKLGTNEAEVISFNEDEDIFYWEKQTSPGRYLVTVTVKQGDNVILVYPEYYEIKAGAVSRALFDEKISVADANLNSYIVTYYANGGTGDDYEQTYDPNSSIKDISSYSTTTAPYFTAPTGKKFTGWNTKADGTGTRYSPSDAPKLKNHLALYAQWCPYDSTTSTYKITSADDMRAFFSYSGMNVYAPYNAKVMLEADITLTDWEVPSYFSGTFSGIDADEETHTIKLLSNKGSSEYAGIFGNLRGTVINLSVSGAKAGTSSTTYSGCIAGYLNGGSIIDCEIEKSEVKGEYAGFVVGYIYNGTVSGCLVGGSPTTSLITANSYGYAGGIAGYNKGTISKCTSDSMTITASYGYAGGVTGRNDGTIENCKFSTPNSKINASYAGGIAGKNESASYIYDCETKQVSTATTTTEIKGTTYSGGITGLSSGTISSRSGGSGNKVEYVKVTCSGDYLGGAVGKNEGTVNKIYVTGVLLNDSSNADYVGGIAGYSTRAISNSSVKSSKIGYSGTSYNYYVGGIAGYNENTITSCSIGDATLIYARTSSGYAGGIAGQNKSSIKNCDIQTTSETSANKIEIKGYYAGGITGINESSSYIYSCTVKQTSTSSNFITITGYNSTGGIAGKNSDTGTIKNLYECSIEGYVRVDGNSGTYTGGIVGYNESTISDVSVTDVYITGNSSGDTYTGGIAGYNENKITSSTVSGADIYYGKYIGGVAGYNENLITDATILNATISSSAYEKNTYYVAGVAGYSSGSITNPSVSSCIIRGTSYYALINEISIGLRGSWSGETISSNYLDGYLSRPAVDENYAITNGNSKNFNYRKPQRSISGTIKIKSDEGNAYATVYNDNVTTADSTKLVKSSDKMKDNTNHTLSDIEFDSSSYFTLRIRNDNFSNRVYGYFTIDLE